MYERKIDQTHVPLSNIQKIIGKRMLASKRTKPCFYLTAQADVTEMIALRTKLKKTLGIKVTTNTFYIRALALSCEKFPLMIGRLDGDTIKIPNDINVGFAVTAPHGLVVPVVKNADQKTLAVIAQIEKDLTDKSRSNTLTLDDMENETIALSNLGSYAVDSFIGILPPQTSTILSVGHAASCVIPGKDCFEDRKILSMTLAVDHRVINGSYAAQFLGCVKDYLENPTLLID
jgi:pyruvate dehydrogenase E2 component (dihydrolipoamide acetyltransferase)